MLRKGQQRGQKPTEVLSARLKKAREQLKLKKLDGLLVSSAANRLYLTGWYSEAEAGPVLITQNKAFIITDSRYGEHAAKETVGFEIVETREGVGPTLRNLARSEDLNTIGFESHYLSVFSFKRIKRFLRGAKLLPTARLIEGLRAVKDEIELERIRKAVEVADKTFDRILNFVKPGLTEREIAWEMEKFMKEAGVERLAWEPFIVAAGANSSMAHWGASGTKIKEKDMILVDFGCVYQSYCSDLSRVIFVGKPSAEQVKIYKLVLEAQKFGIGLVKEGRIGSTVDKKTRLFLEKRLSVRQAKNIYRHALGHGVGLEVHELPPLSIRHKHKLAAGNVVTVEPGIYIPGWGGVRIEDMVLVTENGGKVLTKASKKIEEVTV